MGLKERSERELGDRQFRSLTLDADSGEATGIKVVHVGAGSEVWVRDLNGSARRVRFGNLVAGSRIRVETTGVEMRSLPPQYNAVLIEILPSVASLE